MEISYQLTEDDYRQGYAAFRRRTKLSLWLRRLSYAVFYLVLALTVFVIFFSADRSFSTLFPLLFFVVFWVCCIWYSPRYVARKMIKGSPSASLPHTAEISENGLRFRTPDSESRLGWDLIVGWAEAERVFALFPSPVMFFPIPQRAMTSQQESEFRDLLRNQLPRAK